MSIENSVFKDFLSTFVDSINVRDCRLSGGVTLNYPTVMGQAIAGQHRGYGADEFIIKVHPDPGVIGGVLPHLEIENRTFDWLHVQNTMYCV